MTATPNLALEQVPSGSLQPGVPLNDALEVLDALTRPGGIVQDKDLTTPPTTVSGDVGKRWIIPSGAAGDWSGKTGQIALCTAATVWRYFTPVEGWAAYVLDEDLVYTYSGTAWALSAVASAPYDLIVAIGDETTAITTGLAKVTFRAPRAMTLTKIKASLTTASTSGNPAFDVNKNGVSMFSTTLTIDANEKTSETATTPAVLSSTAIAADDEITIDIDTAGTGANGAKITLVGTAS